ncbi:MAG: TonB-dependent receptor, partial [Bacteroidota bacterium]
MKLKAFSLICLLLLVGFLNGQNNIQGVVTDITGVPISDAEVYVKQTQTLVVTNKEGEFTIENIATGSYDIIVFALEYGLLEKSIDLSLTTSLRFELQPLAEQQLSEVVLTQEREKVFALQKLKAVEGTAIYAGKKSEVVLVENLTGNLAVNNARQVYNQVVGLNIYDNGDGGLQLNIGGRGLDPNRTANFNVRQNGYDISADALGYPESYYTPAVEALEQIQVVRGAASLQYGPQFGGLINFKFKKPNPNKKIELISRQTVGSFNLLTSFNSLSGTVGNFSYYTYFNYKEGDGFRPNSNFNSRNYFGHFGYQLSNKTKITGELTLFNYLTKQAGGLTDVQFNEDPSFSNRSRNWFDVDWFLYALRVEHDFSPKTDLSIQVFGLDATRSAVGYRENRVFAEDDLAAPRELLVDNFANWGFEGRLLHRYQLLDKKNILLLGTKYYDANNDQRQGPGSQDNTADFNFRLSEFPNYGRQAQFAFPNKNLAFFAENIFYVTDKLSITPGLRWEYIRTESDGFVTRIETDLAGNVLLNEDVPDNRTLERDFFLFGVGLSYKANDAIELYGNFSENYRSVTFNDLRIVTPSFVIDPNIADERGYTMDLGLRGRWGRYFAAQALSTDWESLKEAEDELLVNS